MPTEGCCPCLGGGDKKNATFFEKVLQNQKIVVPLYQEKETTTFKTPMDMKTWNIYIAESVYTKKEDGKCYKNYLSLKTIAEGLNDFRTECWPIIDEMKNELISNGAWEGCLSRSEDWCEDHLTRYATDSDTERDSMFPDFIGIDIITTPFTLSLKSE